MGEGVERTVGFALLDALCYSMAAALDYMGKDGQEMLIKIAKEMFNYLVERGHIDVTGDPEEFEGRVTKFFIDNGLMDGGTKEMKENIVVSSFKNYAIFDAVKYLSERGSTLIPCPLCLLGEAKGRSQGIESRLLRVEVVDPEKRDLKLYSEISFIEGKKKKGENSPP